MVQSCLKYILRHNLYLKILLLGTPNHTVWRVWLHVTFPVHTKWSRIMRTTPYLGKYILTPKQKIALFLTFHGHGDTDQAYPYHITSYLYRKLEQ